MEKTVNSVLKANKTNKIMLGVQHASYAFSKYTF